MTSAEPTIQMVDEMEDPSAPGGRHLANGRRLRSEGPRVVDPDSTLIERLIDPSLRRQDVPPRPRTRAECPKERPCVHVSCADNLYLDVMDSGSIRINFPDLEPGEIKHSCALDIAEHGGCSLEDLAIVLNITRERVRQIEAKALRKLAHPSRGKEAREAYADGENLLPPSVKTEISQIADVPSRHRDPEETEEVEEPAREPPAHPATINALGIVQREGGVLPEIVLPRTPKPVATVSQARIDPNGITRRDSDEPKGAADAADTGRHLQRDTLLAQHDVEPVTDDGEPDLVPQADDPREEDATPAVAPAATLPLLPPTDEVEKEEAIAIAPDEPGARKETAMVDQKCSVPGCEHGVRKPKSGVELPGADMTKCMLHRADALGMKRWDYCKAIKKHKEELAAEAKKAKREKRAAPKLAVVNPAPDRSPDTDPEEPEALAVQIGAQNALEDEGLIEGAIRELRRVRDGLPLLREAYKIVEAIGWDTARALAAKIGAKA